MTEASSNQIKTKKEVLDLLLGDQAKELNLEDLISVQEKFGDPVILSVLIFKLMEERKKTNDLLAEINSKYEDIQYQLKNKQSKENLEKDNFHILSEIDDQILSFIRSKGKADAEQVQDQFSYKGSNAASQRLNKLVKENYLSKIQAGRKVYFVVK